jgi:hypothetical protein
MDYTMDLRKYKEVIYGKLQNHLFIWDSSWETFRPIDSVKWTGNTLKPIYTHMDMFDPYYGFGSEEMKKLCNRLTEITELDSAIEGLPWLSGEWFVDREVAFHPCSEKTKDSWKHYVAYTGGSPRTLRRQRIHATKRLIPK